jgi:hypothetical protein
LPFKRFSPFVMPEDVTASFVGAIRERVDRYQL